MGTITIENSKRMLLHYREIYYLDIKKMYLLISILILAEACSPNSKKDFVKEFYDKAKQHESELSIFYNVSFTARGSKDGKPLIPRIEIALDENETITLPGISKGMSDEEIMHLPFFENIEVYSNKVGLTDSALAYKEVRNYCLAIVELARKLEVYKVQSTPRLGKFIIFTLTPNDQVIYIPDLSEVNQDYWKNFFDKGKKLGENWYYRETK
jgi:hypothetical protein